MLARPLNDLCAVMLLGNMIQNVTQSESVTCRTTFGPQKKKPELSNDSILKEPLKNECAKYQESFAEI